MNEQMNREADFQAKGKMDDLIDNEYIFCGFKTINKHKE